MQSVASSQHVEDCGGSCPAKNLFLASVTDPDMRYDARPHHLHSTGAYGKKRSVKQLLQLTAKVPVHCVVHEMYQQANPPERESLQQDQKERNAAR